MNTPPQITLPEILVAQIAITPPLMLLGKASLVDRRWAMLLVLVGLNCVVLGWLFNLYWPAKGGHRNRGVFIQAGLAACSWTLALSSTGFQPV